MEFVTRLGKPLAILWVIWVVATYLLFQPDTSQAIFANPYLATITIFTVIGIAGHFFLKTRKNSFKWRGIYWLVAILITSFIIIPAYFLTVKVNTSSLFSELIYYSIFSTILLLGLTLIFSSSRILGHYIYTKILGVEDNEHAFLKIALGISIQTFVATILGMVGWFHSVSIAILVLLPIVLGYKTLIANLQNLLLKVHTVKLTKSWEWPLYLILIITITINWISSIKAFPTGNDGASLYMATAHKLAESGQLPTGGQAYAWSVFMAFGETLFQSETISILLSHSMFFLCLLALYSIARIWLKKPYALLTIILVGLSPYLAFHAVIDEKVDLALLFFILVIFHYLLRQFLTKKWSHEELNVQPELLKVVFVIGWLCGFCFTIKYSFVLVLFGLLPIVVYRSTKSILGLFLIILGSFIGLGIDSFGGLTLHFTEKTIVSLSFIIAGASLLIYNNEWRIDKIKRALSIIALFIVCMGLPFLPWMTKNLNETEGISLEHILEGEKNRPILLTDPTLFGMEEHNELNNRSPLWEVSKSSPEFISLPQENLTSNAAINGNQSTYEELQRYLGFEDGFWRYASLPTDLTFSINVARNRYVVIGFIFLCLLPLLFFVKGKTWQNIGLSGIGFLTLAFSLVSINEYTLTTKAADRILLGVDQAGNQPALFEPVAKSILDILVHPIFHFGKLLQGVYDLIANIGQGYSALAITMLCLLLVYTSRQNFAKWSQSFRLLSLFIFMTCLAWWLFGMGVIWYGLISFAILPILLISIASGAEKISSPFGDSFLKRVFMSVIVAQVAITFLMQFTNPRVGGDPAELFSRPHLSFAMNPSYEREDALGDFNPQYPEIIKRLNEDSKGKIYLINTQLGYHIKNYDGRVFEDNLLIWYGSDQRKYGESLEYAKSLSLNNFDYLLFDMGTYSMDKTPEKRLAQRTAGLIRSIYDSEWAELIMTDNYVYDEAADLITLPDGQRTFARQGIIGQTIYRGSFMLFKIK
jgi:hypothetical protein